MNAIRNRGRGRERSDRKAVHDHVHVSGGLRAIEARLARFSDERDWRRFHSPKNLAMAVSIEAAELLELYLWRDEREPADRARVEEEIADVGICLLNLCRVLGVDLVAAMDAKIDRNARKYPAAKWRGKARVE